MSDYSDIIDLPRHVSKVHPQMPREQRAAQFAPFAALTGYDKAIEEVKRETEEEKILAEDEKEALDEALSYALEHPGTSIKVIWFRKDKIRNDGSGEYIESEGVLRRVDIYREAIILQNGDTIPIAAVKQLKLPIKEDPS